jgi:hypothetical protein
LPDDRDIRGFVEDEAGVRPAYLARHALTHDAMLAESRRLEAALASHAGTR